MEIMALMLINLTLLAMYSQHKQVIHEMENVTDQRSGITMKALFGDRINVVTLVTMVIVSGIVWSIIWLLPEPIQLIAAILWAIYWPMKAARRMGSDYLFKRKLQKTMQEQQAYLDALNHMDRD